MLPKPDQREDISIMSDPRGAKGIAQNKRPNPGVRSQAVMSPVGQYGYQSGMLTRQEALKVPTQAADMVESMAQATQAARKYATDFYNQNPRRIIESRYGIGPVGSFPLSGYSMEMAKTGLDQFPQRPAPAAANDAKYKEGMERFRQRRDAMDASERAAMAAQEKRSADYANYLRTYRDMVSRGIDPGPMLSLEDYARASQDKEFKGVMAQAKAAYSQGRKADRRNALLAGQQNFMLQKLAQSAMRSPVASAQLLAKLADNAQAQVMAQTDLAKQELDSSARIRAAEILADSNKTQAEKEVELEKMRQEYEQKRAEIDAEQQAAAQRAQAAREAAGIAVEYGGDPSAAYKDAFDQAYREFASAYPYGMSPEQEAQARAYADSVGRSAASKVDRVNKIVGAMAGEGPEAERLRSALAPAAPVEDNVASGAGSPSMVSPVSAPPIPKVMPDFGSLRPAEPPDIEAAVDALRATGTPPTPKAVESYLKDNGIIVGPDEWRKFWDAASGANYFKGANVEWLLGGWYGDTPRTASAAEEILRSTRDLPPEVREQYIDSVLAQEAISPIASKALLGPIGMLSGAIQGLKKQDAVKKRVRSLLPPRE